MNQNLEMRAFVKLHRTRLKHRLKHRRRSQLAEMLLDQSVMQRWTEVSKAARENVRNGPKFAKTILYLNINNGPSKLKFGTALVAYKDVQRRQSGLKSGEVVDMG